jgi:peptidylprolyl isomerase
MHKRALGLCLALALVTTGCYASSQKSGSESTSSTTGVTGGDAAASGGASKLRKLASGLQYEDIVVGSGKMAEPGMNVSVHYTGTLTDGTQFDTSRDSGRPLQFQLGSGRVITGWEEGIKGMRIGGKRKLIVPPDLGYGARGNGPVPPNATMIFDLELVDVQ